MDDGMRVFNVRVYKICLSMTEVKRVEPCFSVKETVLLQ